MLLRFSTYIQEKELSNQVVMQILFFGMQLKKKLFLVRIIIIITISMCLKAWKLKDFQLRPLWEANRFMKWVSHSTLNKVMENTLKDMLVGIHLKELLLLIKWNRLEKLQSREIWVKLMVKDLSAQTTLKMKLKSNNGILKIILFTA